MKKKLRSKKWIKVVAITFITVLLGLTGIVAFSPYRYDTASGKKMISHSVIIQQPAEVVFNYLGRSANASKWSVFVDHIDPLPNGIPDGKAGSLRRCFCNSNKKGTRWDEEITLVEPNKRRQLRIYNMVDFSMKADGVYTEQLYERLGNNKTRLTFTVFYKNHIPTPCEEFKTYLAAYKMKRIFRTNMNNIKKIMEAGS